MSNFSDKVKIQHRLNKLKLKAGVDMDDDRFGYIDPKAIRDAQNVIHDQESNYSKELEAILVQLDSTWEDLKKEADPKKIKVTKATLYNFANNIKDMAETYSYILMGEFGESLRDFCEKLDSQNPAHQTIVQAHIDVMWVAFKHDIKDEGGDQAQELKAMLARAIEKHS